MDSDAYSRPRKSYGEIASAGSLPNQEREPNGVLGSAYHSREWVALLEKIHGHKDLSISNKNGFFPLSFVKSPLFGNRVISVPFADYGGVVAESRESAGKLVEEALQRCAELKPQYLEVRAPAYGDVFSRHGFERRDDYVTFKLDLSVVEGALWKNLEKRTRNGIVHGQKEKLELRQAGASSDVRLFYSLYTKTMKSIGSPPQPPRFFEELWKAFSPARMRIYLAEKDGKPLAGMLCFTHGGNVHYAYSCSDPHFKAARASDALLWHALSELSEQGFGQFDFGRTRPSSGVFAYKQGWGGAVMRMPYYYKFYGSRFEQRDEQKYAALSRLWRDFLPKPLADRLGPKIIRQIG